MSRRSLLTLLLLPLTLHAEVLEKDDERRVVSPNGQFEFRIFVGHPAGALWTRIGYQLDYRGKPLLSASWFGLDFRDQEPLLAENAGLMYSDSGSDPQEHYNYLVMHYVQNGSLGRRLDVEARAYNDGVAFRYVIPRTTPLDDFLLRDEVTQFNLADPAPLSRLAKQPDYDIPFMVQAPDVGWIVITAAGPEAKSPKNPPTYLIRSDSGLQINLARSKTDPTVAYAGVTPVTWPWRVVLVASDHDHFLASETLRSLNR